MVLKREKRDEIRRKNGTCREGKGRKGSEDLARIREGIKKKRKKKRKKATE